MASQINASTQELWAKIGSLTFEVEKRALIEDALRAEIERLRMELKGKEEANGSVHKEG